MQILEIFLITAASVSKSKAISCENSDYFLGCMWAYLHFYKDETVMLHLVCIHVCESISRCWMWLSDVWKALCYLLFHLGFK